jgi:hypothetical protein
MTMIARTADIPRHVRRSVMERCRGRCERCGTRRSLELHHLAYWLRDDGPTEPIFGKETPDDLLALCRDCHKARHIDLAGDFWVDPEETADYWESFWREIGGEG